MDNHGKINYIEFPARNIAATKNFFSQAFSWSFEDYGPDYTSFTDAGIAGGFYKAEVSASTENGSVLVVLYSQDLEATYTKVVEAGGTIVKEIFSFPGGKRFHFQEPSGNELAVWSEQKGQEITLAEAGGSFIQMLKKIISGGQTGADRAALDAGMESRFPVGGSCPSGRRTEDGPLALRYPLNEIQGGYKARTRKNVEDSDGTVIFYEGYLHGGTEETAAFCIKLEKPYKLIDIDTVSVDTAANKVQSFISDHRIQVLNVAGPRLSQCSSIYDFVKNTMHQVIGKSQ